MPPQTRPSTAVLGIIEDVLSGLARQAWSSGANFSGVKGQLRDAAEFVSGRSVPAGWTPTRGGTIEYDVRNKTLLQYLRQLAPAGRKKVIKKGNPGEIHYLEHQSGQVADVKYFP